MSCCISIKINLFTFGCRWKEHRPDIQDSFNADLDDRGVCIQIFSVMTPDNSLNTLDKTLVKYFST